MKVAAVAKEFGAMLLIPDLERVSAKEVEELCEDVAGAVGNAWRNDRGWAQQIATVEAGEELAWVGEEDGEPEGEEIGRVAGSGEDVARDLEMAFADLDEDLGFE